MWLPFVVLVSTAVTTLSAGRVSKPDTITVERLKRARTPTECFTLANVLTLRDLRTERRETAVSHYQEYLADCGRRLDPMAIDPSELPMAERIYQIGHLDRQLFEAFDRSIAIAPTDSGRAAAILRVMGRLAPDEDFAEMPSWIEAEPRYLARLEQVPGVSPEDLIQGHLKTSEVHVPGDSAWQRQVDSAAVVAQRLSTAQRQTHRGRAALCALYDAQANGAAHRDDYQRAIALVDQCLALLPPPQTDSEKRQFNSEMDFRVRQRREFALVGQPVPAPLDAPYWLNASSTMKGADLTRPATLVEFTWSGCEGCIRAYPILRKIYRRLHDRGVNVIFITYLSGATAQRDTATVEQELAYDRWFWHEDQPVPFSIGVLAHPDQGRYPPLFDLYAFIGAPTYYIIDGHGVVRFVQLGSGRDLEARLTGVIKGLLKESSTG